MKGNLGISLHEENKRQKNDAGFTLIEVIIALAVIVTGLVGALVLATSNYRASRDNISRVFAANLARSAVEAVRNTRDTNWLRSDLNILAGTTPYTWDRFAGVSGASVAPAFIVGQGTPDTYSFTKVDVPDPFSSGCQRLDYMCSCLKMAGDLCALSFGIPVGYGYNESLHRLVVLQDICWNDTNDVESTREYGLSCATGDVKIGVLVTGIVKYGSSQMVTVKEKLYNWRE